MITIDDLEELKRKVFNKQQEKDRADGALSQVMSRIKSEFGVSTIKEAKALLVELEEKERKESIAYTKAKREFENAVKGKLD